MGSRHGHGLQVGDEVQLRDPSLDAVGTVVALLRGDDHVRVEWQTGEGYAGKRIMLSARAVVKRRSS
jgi:hypothetical protein